MRGDFVRVEPDTHGVFAAGKDLHIADPRQPCQRVLHMQRRVVRDVKGIAGRIGRIEVYCEQDVGRRLPHLHAEPLHVFRQPGQRVLDAVLRQHLRHVQIGPDPERHGDSELAVACRLARHVDHVLDAVDLLLERRRHRARHRLGGGAGIGRGDLHRRRHDLRILRDRQDVERPEPDQRQEDGKHCREDRPVDEAVGHGARSCLKP